MSGYSSVGWDGLAGDPGAAHWNATRQPSDSGNGSAGRKLKEAQKERQTNVFVEERELSERLHRCRAWARRDASVTVPLQLEGAVSHG